MNKRDFESLKRGMAQVEAFRGGDRKGFVVHEPVNIKAIRTKAKMTQEVFAKKLHIPVATIRDWEQGRRAPDAPARTLLGMVDADPATAMKLLAKV